MERHDEPMAFPVNGKCKYIAPIGLVRKDVGIGDGFLPGGGGSVCFAVRNAFRRFYPGRGTRDKAPD